MSEMDYAQEQGPPEYGRCAICGEEADLVAIVDVDVVVMVCPACAENDDSDATV